MSLFIDGDVSHIDDLRAYDSPILELSAAEGIDLSAKLRVAAAEIRVELEEFLQKRARGAAARVEQVVVTPALKQWHTVHSLALAYGDMYGNHMNDRYERKWKEYKLRARQAAATAFQIGIGMAAEAVPKATPPIVRATGGSLMPYTYIVRIAWQTETAKTGTPSDAVTVTLETGGGLAVRAVNAPSAVSAYSVYASTTDEQPTRQNATPVPKHEEWVMPFEGLIEGEPLPMGPTGDWFVRNDRVLQRG
ncbi:MAG: hypothetical protein KIT09_27685 [Bryobacteraceae bacterium]|nr:hypothetical protein [Bryobacteraceae bacterium]